MKKMKTTPTNKTTRTLTLNEDQQKFLTGLLPAILRLQKRAGLPASVVLAQAILETGWGRSTLSRRNKNLFGIKAHRGTASVLYTTTEYDNGSGKPAKARRVKARFARYPSYDECLADYVHVLSRPRYQPALQVADDPFAFAKALQRCGYATDPRYAAKLSALMRKHDLTQYDLSSVSGDP